MNKNLSEESYLMIERCLINQLHDLKHMLKNDIKNMELSLIERINGDVEKLQNALKELKEMQK